MSDLFIAGAQGGCDCGPAKTQPPRRDWDVRGQGHVDYILIWRCAHPKCYCCGSTDCRNRPGGFRLFRARDDDHAWEQIENGPVNGPGDSPLVDVRLDCLGEYEIRAFRLGVETDAATRYPQWVLDQAEKDAAAREKVAREAELKLMRDLAVKHGFTVKESAK